MLAGLCLYSHGEGVPPTLLVPPTHVRTIMLPEVEGAAFLSISFLELLRYVFFAAILEPLRMILFHEPLLPS